MLFLLFFSLSVSMVDLSHLLWLICIVIGSSLLRFQRSRWLMLLGQTKIDDFGNISLKEQLLVIACISTRVTKPAILKVLHVKFSKKIPTFLQKICKEDQFFQSENTKKNVLQTNGFATFDDVGLLRETSHTVDRVKIERERDFDHSQL